jgi:putative spermidine/putrescine transport system permease protein
MTLTRDAERVEQQAHGPATTPLRRRRRRQSASMLALDLLCGGIALFLIAPAVVLLVGSITAGNYVGFPPPGISLRWYLAIPPRFLDAAATSLAIGACSTMCSVALAVPAAIGMSRGRVRLLPALDAFLRAPLQVPYLVMGVAVMQFYIVLRNVTETDLRDSVPGLILAHVVAASPFVYTATLARLATFDRRIEEAAYGLGASWLAALWFVTLPVLRPAIFAGAFWAFVVSFQDVPISLFLVGTRTSTLPIELYRATDQELSPYIFAVGFLVILFSVVLTLLFERFVGLRGAIGRAAQ